MGYDFDCHVPFIIGNPVKNSNQRNKSTITKNHTKSKASLWLETIQDSLDKVNDMFDLNISVKFRFDQEDNKDAAVDNGLV